MIRVHGANLRKGRYSMCNGVYVVTSVTHDRDRLFEDFWSGRIVVNAMRHHVEKGNVESLTFVVMPDHMHWLISLTGKLGLSELMRSVKGYSSHCLKEIRGRSAAHAGAAPGPVWQEGYHDHALRRDEDVRKVARYVVANPVRAGIVTNLWDYPLWDAVWVE